MIALLLMITALRVVVDQPGPLYLIPVILAALWFGPWAGLGAGVAGTLLFAFAGAVNGGDALIPSGGVRLLLYAGVGWLIGNVSDSRVRLALQLQERDLKLEEVRTIQEALAPSEPPERPGLELASCYLPAEQGVSGDFFVVAPGHEGATLIVVGDVAGRGLEAARRAWYIRTVIASSADMTRDPAAVLERANRALIDDAGFEAPFVTAAVLMFEPGGRLQWALAGHDRPIRLDEGSALDSDGSGVPLGVSDRLGCRTASTQLAPGAGVLLFTDGLTEARRPPNGSQPAIELFGEERIKALLGELGGSPAAEVVERVQQEARGFSGGRLADDLCLIAIRNAAEPDSTEAC